MNYFANNSIHKTKTAWLVSRAYISGGPAFLMGDNPYLFRQRIMAI